MNFILKLKHWQIFIFIFLAFAAMNFTFENNQTLTLIIRTIGVLIYFIWVLITGIGLYHLLPNNIELNYNLFLINSFIWLTTYISIVIISDGSGMSFGGFAALLGFYVFYAFLNFISFPAKTLKSLEKDKKVGIGEYIGYFFLILFLPIGIWYLQPKINKVLENKK